MNGSKTTGKREDSYSVAALTKTSLIFHSCCIDDADFTSLSSRLLVTCYDLASLCGQMADDITARERVMS